MAKISRSLKRPIDVFHSTSQNVSGFGVPIMVVQLIIVAMLSVGVFLLTRPSGSKKGSTTKSPGTNPPTNPPGNGNDTTDVPIDGNDTTDTPTDPGDKTTNTPVEPGSDDGRMEPYLIVIISVIVVGVVVVLIASYQKWKEGGKVGGFSGAIDTGKDTLLGLEDAAKGTATKVLDLTPVGNDAFVSSEENPEWPHDSNIHFTH